MAQKVNGLLLIGILILIAVPFLAGWYLQGEQHVFGGFILNPIDGNSYLAKMQTGMRGEWQFHLPYTATQGDGAFLFLFYTVLGHFARLMHLDPILIFHAARAFSSMFLVISLSRFLHLSLGEVHRSVFNRILILMIFGSGMGWLAAFAGGFTMDFWVAEAYPFLSMLANPHFPLGLAILVQYLSDLQQEKPGLPWVQGIAGALLAVILPFGVVVGGAITLCVLVIRFAVWKKISWRLPVLFFIPAGGILVYQYLAVLNNPLLAIWNRQNQTPSPPLWDIMISLAPGILLAIIGLYWWAKKKRQENLVVAAAWLIVGVVLAYIPFALQRRFLLGVYVPVAIFAGVGLISLVGQNIRRYRRLFWLVFLPSILTNLFILMGGFQAAVQHEQMLFQRLDQRMALGWLNEQACSNRAVVLANPTMGLLIPAHTHCRVIYGHPFETVDATFRVEEINQIFSGNVHDSQLSAFIEKWDVRYILVDSIADRLALNDSARAGLDMVYENNTVRIFRVEALP
ncbi:MAG: hypothetical protein AB1453_14050 [Chloroflexota bacterium]|jgi:hypothetical protein